MEDLARWEPGNLSYQRGLMLAYSHVGDVLGSPNMPSLGDAAAAMDAYRRIQGVAHHLYESDPADQRAARDYAIALARVASGMPDGQAASRVPLLQESARLLQDVARLNPENLVNRADLGHGYNMLGDALYGAGDRSAAVSAYRESAALSETMLDAGQGSPVVTLVSVCVKLGRDAARHGDRESSLKYARRALDLSDPSSPAAKVRPDILQRFLTPRGPTAMGLVYADLSRLRNTIRDQARADRADAIEWLEKSLTAWRKVESDPAFAPTRRKEMQQAEAALASLTHPSASKR
jgi:tetratricopeptide (TPR) repeat protein